MVDDDRLSTLERFLDETCPEPSRRLLDHAVARDLAATLGVALDALRELVPVQATYFPKSADKNWSVRPHRDVAVPVRAHADVEGWTQESVKEGIPFVAPPREVLADMLAARLQVDETDEGSLRVQPGSHRADACPATAIEVSVPRGGVLLMRPLLVHASSKMHDPEARRRVVHVLYGPAELPAPFVWFYG